MMVTSEKKSPNELSTLGGGGGGTGTGSLGATALPALTIVYHPDLDRVGERALLADLVASRPALLSRTEPDFLAPGELQGEPLGDRHLSRKPICLVPAGDGGVRLELGDSSTAVTVRGARVQGSVRFSAAQLQRGVVLQLGQRVVLLLHLVTSFQPLRSSAKAPGEPHELVGESDGLRKVLWDIQSIADLERPVLLRGETGTGKELVASAIHRASRRRDRPFVAVNLAAITLSLATAELFGVEPGAHSTAARRQLGYVEQADGGTLFLDEIGEALPELQVTLLRFLEKGEAQRVGGKVRKINVRVIAATDANLDAKVAAGTFRAPLLYRLARCEITLPPLRARRDDIGRLLVRFLREELKQIGEAHRLLPPEPDGKPWLPATLVARLADHDWPGNIRQLRNVVEKLVIDGRGRARLELAPPAVERLLADSTLPGPALPDEPAQGPEALRANPPLSRPNPPATPPKAPRAPWRAPSSVTEDEFAEALRANQWSPTATARQLTISRPSLYMLLERYPRVRRPEPTAEEILRCHKKYKGNKKRMVEELQISEPALSQWLRKLRLD